MLIRSRLGISISSPLQRGPAEGEFCSSRGTILVFVAIAMVIIIGLVGLVVDTGLLSSTKHQMNSAAQIAALGAMAEYLENLQDPDVVEGQDEFEAAARQALDRAVALIKANKSLGQGFLEDAALSVSDISLFEPGTGAMPPLDNNGYMQIGLYYSMAPVLNPPLSCAGKYPCFLKAPQSYRGNAIKLKLRVAETNKLKTVFMGVLGIPTVAPEVTVYASLIPRNDAFLLDLSSSVVADNHATYGVVDPSGAVIQGTRSSVSYPVMSDSPLLNMTPALDDYFLCTDSDADACHEFGFDFGNYLMFGDFYGQQFSNLCDSLAATGTPYPGGCLGDGITPEDPFVHYKNRYRGRHLNFGKNLTKPLAGDFEQTLLINYGNENPDSNHYLARPQPLIDMLQAIGTAMNTIKGRSVSADRLNVTGFDRDTFEKRTTCKDPLTCNSRFVGPEDILFTSLQGILNDLQDPDFTDDAFITDKMLIPLPIWTDIFAVLLDSLIQFRKLENVSYAKNSIFLFTDGVATCSFDSVAQFIPFALGAIVDMSGNHNLNTLFNSWVQNRKCSNIFPIFNTFLTILGGNAGFDLAEYFKNNRISVSVVLFGTGTRPHYIARKTNVPGKTGCLAMEDAVIAPSSDPDSAFVDTETTDPQTEFSKMTSSSPDAQFFLPNQLYELLVKPTKGAWIPVLPPLNPDPITGLGVDFAADLETACNSDALAPGGLVRDFSASGTQVVDGNGRVLYDPKGRSVRTQIEEAMQKVLTDPYVLVAPIAGDID